METTVIECEENDLLSRRGTLDDKNSKRHM